MMKITTSEGTYEVVQMKETKTWTMNYTSKLRMRDNMVKMAKQCGTTAVITYYSYLMGIVKKSAQKKMKELLEAHRIRSIIDITIPEYDTNSRYISNSSQFCIEVVALFDREPSDVMGWWQKMVASSMKEIKTQLAEEEVGEFGLATCHVKKC